jgi:hypothetical protein
MFIFLVIFQIITSMSDNSIIIVIKGKGLLSTDYFQNQISRIGYTRCQVVILISDYEVNNDAHYNYQENNQVLLFHLTLPWDLQCY